MPVVVPSCVACEVRTGCAWAQGSSALARRASMRRTADKFRVAQLRRESGGNGHPWLMCPDDAVRLARLDFEMGEASRRNTWQVPCQSKDLRYFNVLAAFAPSSVAQNAFWPAAVSCKLHGQRQRPSMNAGCLAQAGAITAAHERITKHWFCQPLQVPTMRPIDFGRPNVECHGRRTDPCADSPV